MEIVFLVLAAMNLHFWSMAQRSSNVVWQWSSMMNIVAAVLCLTAAGKGVIW